MDSGLVSVDQVSLARALSTRVEACRGLAHGADNQADVQLALIVSDLDMNGIVVSVLDACVGEGSTLLAQWAANFTKTVVLAGNVHKVAGRVGALPMRVRGPVAAVGPASAAALSGLRRLLRPLQVARVPAQLAPLRLPLADSAGAELQLLAATRGIGLHDLLVSLVHTIAESKLSGVFEDAAGITLRFCPDISVLGADDRYVRVHRADRMGSSLRAYTRVFAHESRSTARVEDGVA